MFFQSPKNITRKSRIKFMRKAFALNDIHIIHSKFYSRYLYANPPTNSLKHNVSSAFCIQKLRKKTFKNVRLRPSDFVGQLFALLLSSGWLSNFKRRLKMSAFVLRTSSGSSPLYCSLLAGCASRSSQSEGWWARRGSNSRPMA